MKKIVDANLATKKSSNRKNNQERMEEVTKTMEEVLTQGAEPLENADSKTAKEVKPKKPDRTKKSGTPVCGVYDNFTKSICKPNPGYCETIIANATKSAGGVMYASIPIELLDLDHAYQRALGPYVREMAENWDEFKAGVLCVNYRDGRFFIWDGQNRFEAAKMRGGIERLHCMIRVGWSREEEALAFAKQNERKKRLSAADVIRAEIVGGDPIAIKVKFACDNFGVTCAPRGTSHPGSLCAADRAKRIVATYGIEMLNDIFEVIRDLRWNSEIGGYKTIVLHSLRNVLLMKPARALTKKAIIDGAKGRTLKEATIEASMRYPNLNGTEAMTKLFVDMMDGNW